MPSLYLGTPLWHGGDAQDESRVRRFPSLRGARSVDVAIVGAGFTGATIAWRFADAGVRVAVLEAERVGCGSTSASTALLMQEPDNDLASLGRRYGRRKAVRLWELSRDATHECIAAVSQLHIECELARRDSVYYARTAADAARLRREHRSRRLAGFPGAWLDAKALRRQTGIDGAGGIRVRGNAPMNPVLACRGFIDAAVDRGAMVFERSRIVRIRPSHDHVAISTKDGTVRAAYVVVATGYATPRFRPSAGRVRELSTYVAATRPMTARERRRLGLGRVMVWDTSRPYHYARWTADDRLLIGGGDRRHANRRSRRRAFRESIDSLWEYFTARFPDLGEVTLERAWDGLFAMTPDGLPYIGPHRRYPRHLFALGYGGNGMTLGFLAGRLLLDWCKGRDTGDLELFAFSRFRRNR
jgi:glycine/D-amino acid oxidase-like deaminating enzyme